MYDDDDMARGGAPSKPIAAMQLKSLMKRLKDGKIWSWSIIAMSIRKEAKWERYPPWTAVVAERPDMDPQRAD